MKISKSLEVDTIEYLKMIHQNQIILDQLKNDVNVYSSIISKILNLNVESFNNKTYIALNDIVRICEEDFKKLSNKRNK
jgi:hypothetical protein